MYRLLIISSSTRPGRKGPAVAAWVAEQVEQDGRFLPEVVDLGELSLPMMDEAAHPAERKYTREHTQRWSARVDGADAFVFVTAEYNFSYPAPLKNALDYLYNEWNGKAAGIVCYGGVSGGLRAWNKLKADLSSYKIIPLTDAVPFPSFTKLFNDEGRFVPEPRSAAALRGMLDELARMTGILQPSRSK